MPVRPAPSKQKIHAAPAATDPQAEPPVAVRKIVSPAIRHAAPPAVRAVRPGGSAISEAVEEVRQIVESLEQALEQMEQVLRLAEEAERQKTGDEREIESLRRALRKIQPPRHARSERPPEEE
jgi:predicted RNase H-like nuclease (RuvC/YqgF family)